VTTVHPRTYNRSAMNEAEVERVRAAHPDDPVRLQDGF
jgi:hypothetical protein